MPKEDYLLKYLEKLSRVIAAMLGFRDKGFPEDAVRLAQETYKEMLDFDAGELAVMHIEEFNSIIRKADYSPAYLEALAQLATETAASYVQLDNPRYAESFYQKSLQLYYILNEKDKTFSFGREAIIAELKHILHQE